MRNPLNRPMLAVLLAAGVISLLDSDEPSRGDVRFSPLVRNGEQVGHKMVRRTRATTSSPTPAPRRAPAPKRSFNPPGNWGRPS